MKKHEGLSYPDGITTKQEKIDYTKAHIESVGEEIKRLKHNLLWSEMCERIYIKELVRLSSYGLPVAIINKRLRTGQLIWSVNCSTDYNDFIDHFDSLKEAEEFCNDNDFKIIELIKDLKPY